MLVQSDETGKHHLFNWMLRHALPHMNIEWAYFSDVLHDVNWVFRAGDREARRWVVGEVGTFLMEPNESKKLIDKGVIVPRAQWDLTVHIGGSPVYPLITVTLTPVEVPA